MLHSIRLTPQLAHSFYDSIAGFEQFEHIVGGIVRSTELYMSKGDYVGLGDPLLEIEGDKHSVVISSPKCGVIEKIHVEHDSAIRQNEVIFTIDDEIDRRTIGLRSFEKFGFPFYESYLEILGAIEICRYENGESTHLICNHATILHELGIDSKIVQDQLQKAIDLDETNAVAYLVWANTLDGEFTQKRELIQRALELEPDNKIVHESLAITYSNYGFNKEAIEVLEKMQELFGDSCRIYCLMAAVHRFASRDDEYRECQKLAEAKLLELAKWTIAG